MNELLKYLYSARFLASIAIILIAVVIWILVSRLINRIVSDKSITDPKKRSMTQSFSRIIRYIIVILTLLAVLQINNINVGSIITSLGLVSAVIGLALQDIFKDIIMGYHIITDKFFTVGDVVMYNGTECLVKSFNIKTTKLESIYDHSVTTVSNRNISEITVMSDEEDINIPLPYGKSSEEILPVLSQICKKIAENEQIDKCYVLGTYSFDDSAVCYKIRFICKPELKFLMRLFANKIINDELQRVGIEIPFKQIDIHQK